MNEEIRKQEITESELEKVSGGAGRATSATCPKCGGRVGYMFNPETNAMDKGFCMDCGRKL